LKSEMISLVLFSANPEPCLWYASFLESKFRSAWVSLLLPTIVGLYDTSNEPRPDEIAAAYRVMTKTAIDVVDELINQHILTENDEERAVPNQLVFTAIGLLSKSIIIYIREHIVF
jgi:hypothetical protein